MFARTEAPTRASIQAGITSRSTTRGRMAMRGADVVVVVEDEVVVSGMLEVVVADVVGVAARALGLVVTVAWRTAVVGGTVGGTVAGAVVTGGASVVGGAGNDGGGGGGGMVVSCAIAGAAVARPSVAIPITPATIAALRLMAACLSQVVAVACRSRHCKPAGPTAAAAGLTAVTP
jgi:hypothetical protein